MCQPKPQLYHTRGSPGVDGSVWLIKAICFMFKTMDLPELQVWLCENILSRGGGLGGWEGWEQLWGAQDGSG